MNKNNPDVIKKDNEGNIILIGWNIEKKELKKLIKKHKQLNKMKEEITKQDKIDMFLHELNINNYHIHKDLQKLNNKTLGTLLTELQFSKYSWLNGESNSN